MHDLETSSHGSFNQVLVLYDVGIERDGRHRKASNVVLCGRPARTAELARRWQPVRTSYVLGPQPLVLLPDDFERLERRAGLELLDFVGQRTQRPADFCPRYS